MKTIDGFFGDYRFLSNFHLADVEMDGEIYSSTEHAFQAAKTLNKKERKAIRKAKTPKEAKKLGRLVKLREDWESVKFVVMLDVVRRKFQHPELAELLLATEDAELIEGNSWNDTVWGVCNGKGTNWLGKILMLVRRELKDIQQLQVLVKDLPPAPKEGDLINIEEVMDRLLKK